MDNLVTETFLQPCACGLCDLKVDTRTRRNGTAPKFILGHHSKRLPPAKPVLCACGCGEMTLDRDEYRNPRKYVPGHGWRRKKASEKRNQRFMLHFTVGELAALKKAADGKKLSSWIREMALERIQ
jgi:hypothetical protein